MGVKPIPAASKGRRKKEAAARAEPVREPATRGERRKRETREKLLGAAFKLFAERGLDAVPINDITEAADVGFGSFYNYFASKDAIYEAVISRVFEEFADGLDALTSNVADPAEVLAISIRHAIQRARVEPLWGKLLVRQSLQGDSVERGLGARLRRDVLRGLASQRFVASDPLVSFIFVGSSVLGAITAQALALEGNDALAKMMPVEALDVRTAAAALKMLGLGQDEADAVARLPVPRAVLAAPARGAQS